MLVVLALSGVVAAGQSHPKGAVMNTPRSASAPELTEAISLRLFALWDAWKNQGAAAHRALTCAAAGD